MKHKDIITAMILLSGKWSCVSLGQRLRHCLLHALHAPPGGGRSIEGMLIECIWSRDLADFSRLR